VQKTLQKVRIYFGDDKYTMRQVLATWQNAKNQFSDFKLRFWVFTNKISKICGKI
jgi:hypothetical protein